MPKFEQPFRTWNQRSRGQMTLQSDNIRHNDSITVILPEIRDKKQKIKHLRIKQTLNVSKYLNRNKVSAKDKYLRSEIKKVPQNYE